MPIPGSSAAPVVKLLRLSGFPLLRQLWLEEALFRSNPENWFVINDGVPDPTIVLGISGCVPRRRTFFSFSTCWDSCTAEVQIPRLI